MILIVKKIDSAQCSSGRPTFKEYLLQDWILLYHVVIIT